jgi:hypothetical protein
MVNENALRLAAEGHSRGPWQHGLIQGRDQWEQDVLTA